MLSVHGDGERRHRLENAAGAEVGWIDGRAIGFRGFVDVEGAMRAAVAGAGALHAALRRAYPGWPAYTPAFESLRVMHDGVDEWITNGEVAIARVVRPPADRATGPLGVEFVLPSYASEGVAIVVAQAVGRAVGGFLAGAPALADAAARTPAARTTAAPRWVPDDAA